MDVDARMDRAIRACQRQFGRPVTYAPAGGAPVDDLVGIYTPADQFGAPGFGGNELGLPRMEFRTQDLDDAGIVPTSGDKTASSGDVLQFEVRGESRAYRVVKVTQPDHGSTMLWLARLQ